MAAAFAALLLPADSGVAAPLLREAEARITFTTPTSCEVALALTAEGAGEIDHRVLADDVELVAVQGARQVGDIRGIGRTRSLVLSPGQGPYEFRYRVRLAAERAYRCPVWLPAVPTDGLSRSVTIHVELPASTSAGRSMPALAWTGARGEATLGHLPAFVHVPFGPDGDPPTWDVGHAMDALSLIVLAGATGVWMWRRKKSK